MNSDQKDSVREQANMTNPEKAKSPTPKLKPNLTAAKILEPGDIIRARAFSGDFRVWRVVAVLHGPEHHECVIAIETLDREKNSWGTLLIPEELLNAALGAIVV